MHLFKFLNFKFWFSSHYIFYYHFSCSLIFIFNLVMSSWTAQYMFYSHLLYHLIYSSDNLLIQFVFENVILKTRAKYIFKKYWLLRWFKLKRSDSKIIYIDQLLPCIKWHNVVYIFSQTSEKYLEIHEFILCTVKAPKNIRLEWAVSLLFGSYEVNPIPLPNNRKYFMK